MFREMLRFKIVRRVGTLSERGLEGFLERKVRTRFIEIRRFFFRVFFRDFFFFRRFRIFGEFGFEVFRVFDFFFRFGLVVVEDVGRI